jgi:LPXTG-motif cell wall-anchored protein
VTTADCAPATLAPGESLDCAGTHPLTQEDLDRGFVLTVAGAKGTTPWGDRVSADPGESLTRLAQRPALAVTNTVAVAGTTLTYTVTTKNTGNVTLTAVTPSLTAAELTCAPVTLAPGGTTTCQATHRATGTVTATATASGSAPSGERITSAPVTVTTRVTGPAPQGSGPPTSGLASTGVTAVTEMVVAGVVVLALGLGLLLFARRRRRDR